MVGSVRNYLWGCFHGLHQDCHHTGEKLCCISSTLAAAQGSFHSKSANLAVHVCPKGNCVIPRQIWLPWEDNSCFVVSFTSASCCFIVLFLECFGPAKQAKDFQSYNISAGLALPFFIPLAVSSAHCRTDATALLFTLSSTPLLKKCPRNVCHINCYIPWVMVPRSGTKY